MRITEIAESDFRKLNLVGYRRERIDLPDGSHRFGFVKHFANNDLDEQKKYVNENGTWTKTTAFFFTDEPTEDEIRAKYGSYPADMPEDRKMELAFDDAMMDHAYCDKYCWPIIGTYESWAAVRHIYSKRTKWIIDADSEQGELHKKGIARIYIVHLGE